MSPECLSLWRTSCLHLCCNSWVLFLHEEIKDEVIMQVCSKEKIFKTMGEVYRIEFREKLLNGNVEQHVSNLKQEQDVSFSCATSLLNIHSYTPTLYLLIEEWLLETVEQQLNTIIFVLLPYTLSHDI